jgi:hypothetical protein
MVSPGRTRDKDVVQVDEAVGQAIKNPIHHTLKSLGGIPQAKRHPQELEQAERCHNSRLGNIILIHRYLIISLNKVHFRKNRASF